MPYLKYNMSKLEIWQPSKYTSSHAWLEYQNVGHSKGTIVSIYSLLVCMGFYKGMGRHNSRYHCV